MWDGSSRTFYFPMECSRCCANVATESLIRQWEWVEQSGNVQTTTTLTLSVPVCAPCQEFVEKAEEWTVWVGAGLTLVGAVVTLAAWFLIETPKEWFTVLVVVGVWVLLGTSFYSWLHGVLGLSFVRPVDNAEYLRFTNGEYQYKFDRANPAASRRPEGYFTQSFLYLVYLAAALTVPLFGVFFWLATYRDHRRLVMKWLILGLSLAIAVYQVWRLQNGLPWWFPWLPT